LCRGVKIQAIMNQTIRWLAAHGHLDKARHSLAVTHGITRDEEQTNDFVRREAEAIRANVEYENRLKGGWIDCFKPGHKILYRTCLGKSACSP
jgi:SP family sugar:H+ symporter-like MFS transporter